MRNFNNDDLDKYEKMTKNAMAKLQQKTNFRIKLPRFKLKNVVSAILVSGLTYVGYRIYDYRKYRNEHYIDVFEMKKKVSAKVARDDLISKFTVWNDWRSKETATQNYEKQVSEGFNVLMEKIKKPSRQSEDHFKRQNQSEQKSHKKEERKDRMELILSKNRKAKLDLGFLFQLHAKQYVTTITNTGEVHDKTYIMPFVLLGVPFFVTRKMQKKKVGRQAKLLKEIEARSRFTLSSQCQKINYWNILLGPTLKEKKNRQEQKSEIEIKQQSKPETKTEGESEIEIDNEIQVQDSPAVKASTQKREKNQLLMQCRRKIKASQKELIGKLKKRVKQQWIKKTQNKEQQYDGIIKRVTV